MASHRRFGVLSILALLILAECSGSQSNPGGRSPCTATKACAYTRCNGGNVWCYDDCSNPSQIAQQCPAGCSGQACAAAGGTGGGSTAPGEATWDPKQNTHADGAQFQGLLDRYVTEGIPGVVLFVQTPQGVWNGAAGFSKVETSTRMRPTNLHYAASVTKMYTAAAAEPLLEQEAIGEDEGVATERAETRAERLGRDLGVAPGAGEGCHRQVAPAAMVRPHGSESKAPRRP